MKLIRPQAEGIVQVLKEVLINNRYADKALELFFKKNKHLRSEDRAFIAETSYDIIRYFRLLQYISTSDSLWKLLGTWAIIHEYDLNDWKEFAGIKKDVIYKQHEAAAQQRKIRESIPDWLDDIGNRELGERWEHVLKALNAAPQTTLRTNTLKTTREHLQQRLTEEGIATTPLSDYQEVLMLTGEKNIFQTIAFQDGLFELQDAGSQCIAPFLLPEPGLRIIDACAGTGGKSLHLAALMQNKGRLIALDVAAWKLEELKQRARRAAVHNFETRLIENTKSIKRFNGTADRLLLDVPCSGLGVLKRNPDAKWKLRPEYLTTLIHTQQNILDSYSSMVKVGGLLVYSTCSILPSENENQVSTFLEKHKGKFELVEEKTIHPSESVDGFYMARLKRLA